MRFLPLLTHAALIAAIHGCSSTHGKAEQQDNGTVCDPESDDCEERLDSGSEDDDASASDHPQLDDDDASASDPPDDDPRTAADGGPDDAAEDDGGMPLDAAGPGRGSLPAACTMQPTSVAPRLTPACSAAPTGFCLRSDPGDYIGGGKAFDASGASSVSVGGSNTQLSISLNNDDTSASWRAEFAAKAGESLVPGLHEPAERYPFMGANFAGISLSGNGAGCNTIKGRFSIEELERSPTGGIARLSVLFEQHCEGSSAALRGMINFNARGVPDPTPTGCKQIALTGKVFRLAYDPDVHVAYGLDATNRKLARIDIDSGEVRYVNVVQVPNDACVDRPRQRLFVVNKGSSIVSEYELESLALVREITWAGTDWGINETHYHVYCGAERLYVVDGAWAPGLFSVEDLDEPTPTVVDHSGVISGVGSLVVNAAGSDLYYWYQYGWSAGTLNTAVRRVSLENWMQIDETKATTSQGFTRDPLDTPVLLDESRGLIFNKNLIFDATNLTKLVFTLPGPVDTFDGARENAYALDAERGLLATRNFVYELSRYDVVAPTLSARADQMFFDRDGLLWYLETSRGQLSAQGIAR